MADDTRLYDGEFDSGLMAGDYAERTSGGSGIRIRGSKYIPHDCNYFTPEAARRLAFYIVDLADEIDGGAAAGDGACCCDDCREDPPETESRETLAARRVSAFFDALAENFGPELTQRLAVTAVPVIVGDALCSPRYDESEY